MILLKNLMIGEEEEAGARMIFSKTISIGRDAEVNIICRARTTGAGETKTGCSRMIPQVETEGAGAVGTTVKTWPQYLFHYIGLMMPQPFHRPSTPGA